MEIEIDPQGSEGGLPSCPGCRRTKGPPGALCPYCGSRYPDPNAGEVAAILGIVAAVGIALALLVQGLSEAVAGVAGLIGILALIGAVAMGAQARGHVGPAQPRQASCCGCSCVVALVALPAAGAVLWMHGGPAMAALALPAWIPLSWAIHACERVSRLTRASEPAPNTRCDQTTTRGSQGNRITADK